MRILIANRGEIAARVIRSIKRTGHTAIAIELFGENSLANCEADEVLYFSNNQTSLKDTFLSAENVLDLASNAKIDAIHPGYGFLSESASFAKSTEELGIIFIGPSYQTLEILSDKVQAKELAKSINIPIIPSFNILAISNLTANEKENIFNEAQAIGYPLMVKAAYGGGGRGMREVFSQKELFEQIEIAASEAERAFGNGALFIEKLIRPAQHIEVQVIGDKLGHCIHLFERDCSLQRKHQKLIEFAPAININHKTLAELYNDSLKLAKSAKLTNAATIEFLVNRDTEEYYFIESNPRLQVEHTITEEITGYDIVELQIKSASGHALPNQSAIKKQGFAIQARLCAEIPEKDFAPSTGKLELLTFSENTRIESGYGSASEITTQYDSLIAKIIVHDTNVETTKKHLLRCLNDTIIKGVSTNLNLLLKLVSLDDFMKKGLSVDFIESKEFSFLQSKEKLKEIEDSAISIANALHSVIFDGLDSLSDPFNQIKKPSEFAKPKIAVNIEQLEINSVHKIEDRSRTPENFKLISQNVDKFKNFQAEFMFQGYFIECTTKLEIDDLKGTAAINSGEIVAPLPCQILKVFVNELDQVELGQKLITFESMKTEYSIDSPFSGTIKALKIKPGDRLAKGDRILELIAN